MIRVIKRGLLTTVQDLGRTGYQRYGMPVSGAMDEYAMRLANVLAGNRQEEAVLECTIMGPSIRFETDEVFAVAGGDFGARLSGIPVENNVAYLAHRGDVLELSMAKSGARAYIAFAGGLDILPVMGSCSTCLKAAVGGFKGRPLRENDEVPLKHPTPAVPDLESRKVTLPAYTSCPAVRFTYGPQDSLFSESGKQTFTREYYAVSAQSDRMGFRLEGPAVETADGVSNDIISDGIPFGAIQVTDGRPIVMMADRQTTGGYSKIGCVIAADIPLLAQLKPGDYVRFVPVSVETAQNEYIRQRNTLDALQRWLGSCF